MRCHCQPGEDCGCHGGALHGYRWHLGAITPADAANQVFPTAKIRSGAGHNQSIWNSLQLAAQTGQMVGAGGEIAYIPGTADCASASGTPSGAQNDLKLAQTGAGLALTGVSVGMMAAGTAAAIAAPITLGISIAITTIVGILSTLINHHAAAVRKEQSILCSAVPAANNYLKIISQGVASGLVSPRDGIAALDSLLGDFESAVSGIRHGSDPTSSGECNAACVMQSELHAIVLLMQSQLQDIIDAASVAPASTPSPLPQVVTASRPNTTSPAVPAPASTYSSFYSPAATPAAGPAPTVAAPAGSSFLPAQTLPMVPAGAATGAPGDWLPIAALIVGGIFLLKGL